MKTLDQDQTARSGETHATPPAISMETWIGTPASAPSVAGQFRDRRGNGGDATPVERRQFTNSHEGLSPEAREFAAAVDHYKLANRRRFISYDEILNVVKSLGYHKG